MGPYQQGANEPGIIAGDTYLPLRSLVQYMLCANGLVGSPRSACGN